MSKEKSKRRILFEKNYVEYRSELFVEGQIRIRFFIEIKNQVFEIKNYLGLTFRSKVHSRIGR